MKYKSLVIGILVISLAVNIAQFMAYKQNDKAMSAVKETQVDQQEIADLEELVRQRESRITELQTKLDTEKNDPTEATNVEDTYSETSIEFAKLALGGRVSTEDYETVLEQKATSELAERMKKTVDGEYSGQSSIRVIFSHERAFVDLDTVNKKEIKVFVKLNYKYDTTNTETTIETPESNAYMLLTLTEEEGLLKVSNYEMG